jgi:hypothetical protein
MVTPSGSPPWVRSNDHTAYGGHENKKNYNDVPIVNQRTDVGAEHLVRIAADLAAVARMADFAQLNITMASGSSAPTVNSCRMMTGIYTGTGYSGTSPPTGFPTVNGVSDGVVDIRFSGAYSDPYSVSATFQPVFAHGSVAENAAAAYQVSSFASGTDTVRVRVQTSSGSSITGITVTVSVA